MLDGAKSRERAALFEPPVRDWPPGMLANFLATEHPGRMDVQLMPRLNKLQTPWRSRMYVTARQSADGNDYAPGDPIPEAEAIRQGVYQPKPGTSRTPLRARVLCTTCGGTGLRGRAKAPNHAVDCRCPMCGPCKVCKGARYLEEERDHA